MPVRLCALTEKVTEEAFVRIVRKELDAANDAFAAEKDGKTYAVCSSPIRDAATGGEIGKYVITVYSNIEQQRNEILDIDIVLSNDAPSLLEFCKKLPNSSDSNEYYEVITEDGRHLAVETVNRYAVPDELEGTKREVYASALPFELTVFRDEDAYNRFCGFAKPVKAGGADIEVHGLSTTFTCPSTIFRNGEDDAPWSFVAGEIKNFREITLDVDSVSYKAYLVVLRSALGDLPTLVGNEVFDTSEIAVGKIVGMNAYIKANFIKDKYPNIR